ncbi:hypothetical protein ABZY44_25025 [Streptomyces sp. NPDC006544]|uniref:hypothetical protein n=1 Tax=Streptomyces sp. NPDC006544 TaxID=3154583 RepID=UPI0033A7DA41
MPRSTRDGVQAWAGPGWTAVVCDRRAFGDERARPAGSTSRPSTRAGCSPQEAAAPETELQRVAAEDLQDAYLKDSGHPADELLVEFTDIDYLDLGY